MNKYLKSALFGAGCGLISYAFCKKSPKSFVVGSTLGFAGALWFNNESDKELQKIVDETESEIKKEDETLSEIGLKQATTDSSDNTVQEEENEVSRNSGKEAYRSYISDTGTPLTKRLMNLLLHNSDWNIDLLNGVEDLYEDNYSMVHDLYNSVHILNNPRKAHKYLELLIMVPPYIKNGQNATPSMKNYKETIKAYINEFWKKENIKAHFPRIYTRGYKSYISTKEVIETTDNKYIPLEKFEEISESEHSQYATRVPNGGTLPDGISKMVSYFDDPDKLEEADLLSVTQYIVIELEVQDGTKDGIDKLQLLKLLNNLLNGDELVICQDNGRGEQYLGPLVFHPGVNLGKVYGMDFKEKFSMFPDQIYSKEAE